MRTHFGSAVGLAAIATLLAASACSRAADETTTPTGPVATVGAIATPAPGCVTLQPGSYYWDGQRLVASAITAPPVVAHSGGWSQQVQGTFAEKGFGWMNLSVRDRVAALTGTAPDLSAKERGFAAGEAAIKAHAEGGALIVVDAIAIEGGERGVGESVATLAQTTATLQACQTTFNDVLNGRNVQFAINSANISPVSARLLDAMTAAADLCKAYTIEIGGHTDSKGGEESNLKLSQLRAESVRGYLINRGVDPAMLVAVGYGESQPLDPSETIAAWNKNRRTEIKVRERR